MSEKQGGSHHEPYDDVLEEALGDDPRAGELRSMHRLLVERRIRMAEDFKEEADPAYREKLRKDLVQLDEQIEVLREESSITQFVEDAVRVGIEMRKLQDW